MRRFLACLLLVLLPASALAECRGQNLMRSLPTAEQAALRATAEAAPYARGNFWRARKGSQTITLIGTYHIDDPRHAATLAALGAALAAAHTLLVEAGPAEQAAIRARLLAEPRLMVAPPGASLYETLPPDQWQLLAKGMRARGVAPIIAARLRPWYVTMLLSVPLCALDETVSGGLDAKLIAAAQDRGLPISALEPYDTVLTMFDSLSPADQLAMVNEALAEDSRSADLATTLADSYFAEESRLMWEFSRYELLHMPGKTEAEVTRELATMERVTLTNRNHNWLPVIEETAATGPVLVAVGTLHLAGEDGLLNLLAADGYTLERLPLK